MALPHLMIVGCEVSSDVTLLDYLRLYAGLRGTKYMCREGGCGACIVSVHQPAGTPYAVNSCLMSITSCHGLEITTIEGLGNRLKGYHELQKKLADENGTQCGYCSPGWVMSMYSLLQGKPNISTLDIEKSLGSNICRCTGYRPILQAFKTFAADAPRQIHLQDIEDLKICNKTGETCNRSNCEDSEWCFVDLPAHKDDIIKIKLKDEKIWYRVQQVKDVFSILEKEGDDSYMLVCGNTARGAYPILYYPTAESNVLIDISGVQELKGYTLDQNLIVNAGTTLTEFLQILKTVAKEEYFGYLQKIHDHVEKVAHVAVRNVATIAGNLMIQYQHHWFPSDIFLLLETIGAQVTIQTCNEKNTLTMQEFLKLNMRGKVIRNVMLPPMCGDCHLFTFKIMPRSLNSVAVINAGYLYKLNSDNIVKCARIVYRCLSPSFIRATATEHFLIGKKLFSNETLSSALRILEEELIVEDNPPAPSVEYRKKTALALFYKGLLKLSPGSNLQARYKSGAINLPDTRPVSRAIQLFDTNPAMWPITKPIPKTEALIQCAGEAFYTEDIPTLPNEVFCAFALSTVAIGDIESIDASEALAHPGVIAFYTAKDIPGTNTFFISMSEKYNAVNEEVVASTSVSYFNQAIGIVVAESRSIAEKAAKLVKVTYTNVRKPILDMEQTINDSSRTSLYTTIDATETGKDVVQVIKGNNAMNGQYHFTMETLTSVVIPSDEGLNVYSATQSIETVQVLISKALNIDQNRIDVHVRLVGGGYGLKLSRGVQGAVAAALVATKLNRPCRIIQSLTTTTRTLGKRTPSYSDFEAGVNSSGIIQYIKFRLFENVGYLIKEVLLNRDGIGQFNNAYNRSCWSYKNLNTITDAPRNIAMRAPGTFEHVAMAEFVIEQIAYEMNLDPLDVRMSNLDTKYRNDMKEVVNYVMDKSDYATRRKMVNQFNAENRWKKRGLRFSFMRWTPIAGVNMPVNLSVYRGDGSVAITHGGIEMGQGVNTKAMQVAAYMLNIPIEKIQIKENNTVIGPNASGSGGNVISQNVLLGVRIACQQLLDRLKPIRDQMDNPTWEELITKAYNDNVDLQAHGYTRTDEKFAYDIYGVTLAEVELDVLTGEFELLRVDLCQDVGQSVSPEIDIGQVEGAFMTGIGFWTCEDLVYAPTGELLTDRTWNYHVPLTRDIPQDWRVYFRKNSYTNDLIFGSKNIGEPPICMAVVVALALREAIVAARLESGIPSTKWFREDGPYTVDRNFLLSSTNTADFKFN
ncbi:xanthine dehydrogenase-like [Spodoptera litura]|uniref:Xanthine dehydrogenase-like n=1 Tax=Spodoptera litura TaxID=69820 RepID=A0A9J7E9S7_SPOLT|nr:xanthine dehydrogenase-like [Spodoptera litura]